MGKNRKCPHGIQKHYCRECKVLGVGGSAICEHDRNRHKCRDCRGASICTHGRVRYQCRRCKGGAFCTHERAKVNCSICHPEACWRRCAQSARRRGFQEYPTLEEFKILAKLPCLYCGEAIQPRGIDRWENKVGYIYKNCRSCCRTCNMMKRNMDGFLFMAQCLKVATFVSEGSPLD